MINAKVFGGAEPPPEINHNLNKGAPPPEPPFEITTVLYYSKLYILFVNVFIRCLYSDSWLESDGKNKLKGNDKNGRNTLGSLKDAPPLPGMGQKKDEAPSGNILIQTLLEDMRDSCNLSQITSGCMNPHLDSGLKPVFPRGNSLLGNLVHLCWKSYCFHGNPLKILLF